MVRRPRVFPVFVTGHHCGTIRTIFPVFVTGHHCGPVTSGTPEPVTPVFPVFVTGHHCGPSVILTGCMTRRGLPGLRDRASLRRAVDGEVRGFGRGLPGLRDRASLRHRVDSRLDGRLEGLPGLRDRASLRRQGRRGSAQDRDVFPVFVTGHHCGGSQTPIGNHDVASLPGLRDRASLRRGDLRCGRHRCGWSSRSS